MSLRRILITGCLVLVTSVVAPAKASADWMFTPFIGWNFGGSARVLADFGDFEDDFENRVDFGGVLSWMGGGFAGFEVDFGYSPNFFENTVGDDNFDFGDNNVTTLMANFVFGAPIGGQSGAGFRPYASGGVGLIRSRISGPDDFFDASKNDFGFNVGAGTYFFFADNIGIRGDVRYFRSFQDDEPDSDFDIGLSSFHFWRGSVGVTFRF